MSRNVAILMGGYSSEFEISVKSGEVVFETLIQNKNINVYKIIIEKDDWYHVDYKGSKFPLDKKKFENTLKTTGFEKMRALESKESFAEAKEDKNTGKKIKFFNMGIKNDWKKLLDKNKTRHRHRQWI